jgi:CBS domain-containing protein
MTKNVTFIKPSTPLQEAANLIRDKDIGALPVGENDRLVGIITDRDIVVRALTENTDIKSNIVEQVMSPHCHYCIEDEPLEDLSKSMAMNQVRRLPVLNMDKHLIGIVALGDLSRKGQRETATEALTAISEKRA